MTSAFRGTDAAIVAFLSAVVAQATKYQARPALPNADALFIGDLTTHGLITLRSQQATDLGRPEMTTKPRPNDSTEQDGGATI